eukprot:TRINITY_DN4927_c0_g1_i1.p1 TRINITY_DN4927_c0_g1~~TRINITY_DN4927_c0_g1_i1.p1  ORF type:complete len:811 (+),score=178.60 TRINITY_DN4927_c0_g1_i1:124-2556(+)
MVLLARRALQERFASKNRDGVGGEGIDLGSIVCVLGGRHFPLFSSGDTGRVVRIDHEALNCDVLFDGATSAVPVALRHLRCVEAPPTTAASSTSVSSPAASPRYSAGVRPGSATIARSASVASPRRRPEGEVVAALEAFGAAYCSSPAGADRPRSCDSSMILVPDTTAEVTNGSCHSPEFSCPTLSPRGPAGVYSASRSDNRTGENLGSPWERVEFERRLLACERSLSPSAKRLGESGAFNGLSAVQEEKSHDPASAATVCARIEAAAALTAGSASCASVPASNGSGCFTFDGKPLVSYAAMANGAPVAGDSSYAAPRVVSLEARLERLEERHRVELESLRGALEEALAFGRRQEARATALEQHVRLLSAEAAAAARDREASPSRESGRSFSNSSRRRVRISGSDCGGGPDGSLGVGLSGASAASLGAGAAYAYANGEVDDGSGGGCRPRPRRPAPLLVASSPSTPPPSLSMAAIHAAPRVTSRPVEPVSPQMRLPATASGAAAAPRSGRTPHLSAQIMPQHASSRSTLPAQPQQQQQQQQPCRTARVSAPAAVAAAVAPAAPAPMPAPCLSGGSAGAALWQSGPTAAALDGAATPGRCGSSPAAERAATIFDQLDVNGDGVISREEFSRLLAGAGPVAAASFAATAGAPNAGARVGHRRALSASAPSSRSRLHSSGPSSRFLVATPGSVGGIPVASAAMAAAAAAAAPVQSPRVPTRTPRQSSQPPTSASRSGSACRYVAAPAMLAAPGGAAMVPQSAMQLQEVGDWTNGQLSLASLASLGLQPGAPQAQNCAVLGFGGCGGTAPGALR